MSLWLRINSPLEAEFRKPSKPPKSWLRVFEASVPDNFHQPFLSPRKLYPGAKRLLDIVLALALLSALSPLLIVIWFAVRLTSRGPGLFWSERVGRYGRLIRIPKFRSMTVSAPIGPREAMADPDSHITRLGAFLRNTSIDELPQLYSVLIGQMSFIGPRPLIHSDPAQTARGNYSSISSLRPGLSGLAQVMGRNYVKPEKKARLDAYYATTICLKLDFRIFLRTLRILASREGVM